MLNERNMSRGGKSLNQNLKSSHQFIVNSLQVCWGMMERRQKEFYQSVEKRLVGLFEQPAGAPLKSKVVGQAFKWFINRLYGQFSRQNPHWTHNRIMYEITQSWSKLNADEIKVRAVNEMLVLINQLI